MFKHLQPNFIIAMDATLHICLILHHTPYDVTMIFTNLELWESVFNLSDSLQICQQVVVQILLQGLEIKTRRIFQEPIGFCSELQCLFSCGPPFGMMCEDLTPTILCLKYVKLCELISFSIAFSLRESVVDQTMIPSAFAVSISTLRYCLLISLCSFNARFHSIFIAFLTL